MYKQPTKAYWSGRQDSGANTTRWHERVALLEPPYTAPKGVAFLGFACDLGVEKNQGRVGAKEAPERLKKALGGFAYHQKDMNLYDAGTIEAKGALDLAQEELASHIDTLLKANHFPLVLGGGHETAYASFLGLSRGIATNKNIGILNFDAHFDLRIAEEGTSGTPFTQIAALCDKEKRNFHYMALGISKAANTQALFDTAQRLHVKYVLDTKMNYLHFEHITQSIDDFMRGIDYLYISIDTDVFTAYSVPSVSAMAGRGIDPAFGYELLAYIFTHYKERVTLVDITEFSPRYDINAIGEKTIARLIYDIVDLYAS